MLEKYLRNISVSRKLTLIVMLSCSFALVLAGITFVIYDHMGFRVTMQRSLEILTNVIGANSTAALSFANKADGAEVLTALRSNNHILSATIYSADGELFASYLRESVDVRLLPLPLPEKTTLFDEDFVTYTAGISLENEKLGTITIRSDLDELGERLIRNALLIGLFIIVALIVSYVIIKRLQRLVSEPIVRLAQTASDVSHQGDYSLRADEGGRDEVGTLISTFNKMLGQIQFRDGELTAARDHLEQRVQERTVELEAEIVERKRAEANILKSLHEKDVLLKEVHHRVKNNLQIINSLLNLQAGKVNDKRLEAMFRDSQGRIKSMALIHEKLYQSENLGEIDFSEYVDSLCKYLMSTISGSMGRIRIRKEIENFSLGIDLAIPCGLIINELVMNSLKYAFPNLRTGEIVISCRLSPDDRVVLTVSDDGVGFPEGVDVMSTGSLGMQLVHSLIDQIEGDIFFESRNGVRFAIEFARERRKSSARELANV